MTTTPQAALLSAHWYSIDKHGAATLCVDEDDAKATAIDSQTLYPRNGPYRAVQMAPIEPVQAGELPDEREAFEEWAKPRWLPLDRSELGGQSYHNGDTDLAWRAYQAATARAALSARKPLSRDQVKALKDEYGYSCAPVQAQADFINGIRCGEKAHDIGLEVKT